MLKKIMSLIGGILLSVLFVFTAFAADVPRAETPNYRVAFYASPNYHIQDENGRRYGYGYGYKYGYGYRYGYGYGYKKRGYGGNG